MNEESKWERRIRERKPFFEVADFAITTLTWVSLCVVGSYMVIRGYWTMTPALAEMGTRGIIIYSLFAVPFVLLAAGSSLTLLLAFWSLTLELKWDLEYGENRVLGFFITAFGKLWHYGFGMFLLVLVTILSLQILIAIGEVSQPPRQHNRNMDAT